MPTLRQSTLVRRMALHLASVPKEGRRQMSINLELLCRFILCKVTLVLSLLIRLPFSLTSEFRSLSSTISL